MSIWSEWELSPPFRSCMADDHLFLFLPLINVMIDSLFVYFFSDPLDCIFHALVDTYGLKVNSFIDRLALELTKLLSILGLLSYAGVNEDSS